jgi:folylpolyglutamate synthase/dihydropteroate synthase
LLIFATTQEKDIAGMLSQIHGRFDHVIFTRYLLNPRGVPPEELAAAAEKLPSWGGSSPSWCGSSPSWGGSSTATPASGEGPGNTNSPLPQAGEGQGVRAEGTARTTRVEIASTPADAWAAVHRMAAKDDLICITGSFFLASEMRREMAAWPLNYP